MIIDLVEMRIKQYIGYYKTILHSVGDRRGCAHMVLDLQLPMQSVLITTNVSSNPAPERCTQYNIKVCQ
jgi:hypothetical protein